MSEWQETEFGNIPSHWDYLRIENTDLQIGDGNYSSKYPRANELLSEGIPFISSTDINNGKISANNLRYISTEHHSRLLKGHIKQGDVLIVVRGNGVGQVGLVSKAYEDANLNAQMAYLGRSRKIDGTFLYYLLSKYYSDGVTETVVSGSAQPQITIGNLKQLSLIIPPIIEQKAIASVLSSLDDKIDLLHRQNTTLECMAETLFRQWFIEEAQEDWLPVVLSEYVYCFNGVSYKSSELNPSKTAMVTLKSFDRNGGFRLDGFKEFTGRYKEQHIVAQGDLVVAHTDITQDADVIGNPVLVVASPSYETIVISMDLVKVTSKFDWLSNEFLYRMMRTREFKEHCLGYSNGSTVLHLSKQAIPSYEFLLPPKVKIQSFTSNAKDLLGKKFKNIEQIQTLEKLRDSLLPKLMNGEIRINNV